KVSQNREHQLQELSNTVSRWTQATPMVLEIIPGRVSGDTFVPEDPILRFEISDDPEEGYVCTAALTNMPIKDAENPKSRKNTSTYYRKEPITTILNVPGSEVPSIDHTRVHVESKKVALQLSEHLTPAE